jgi:hypothetical protein
MALILELLFKPYEGFGAFSMIGQYLIEDSLK